MISLSPTRSEPGRGSWARGKTRLLANLAAGHCTALPGETPIQHALRLQEHMRPAGELPLVSRGQGDFRRDGFAPAPPFNEAGNHSPGGAVTPASSTGE